MKYIKILLLLFAFLSTSYGVIAQGFGGKAERYDPVSWSGEIEKLSNT
jgi:hypothetical protein